MKTNQTKVFFRYEKEEVQTPKGIKLVNKVNGTITAVARNIETGEEIASREVKLRHGDVSNKVIGRKYVFKKLMDYSLNNNLLPRPEISELWKLFGSTCKQPNVKLAY
jgi:hypothetical protein